MDKYKKVRTYGRLLGDFGVFDAEFGAIGRSTALLVAEGANACVQGQCEWK